MMFYKPYQEINSVFHRWSRFLTKADKLDKDCIPTELKMDKNIVKAINGVDRMFDEEERIIYETRMQSLADIESKVASAVSIVSALFVFSNKRLGPFLFK